MSSAGEGSGGEGGSGGGSGEAIGARVLTMAEAVAVVIKLRQQLTDMLATLPLYEGPSAPVVAICVSVRGEVGRVVDVFGRAQDGAQMVEALVTGTNALAASAVMGRVQVREAEAEAMAAMESPAKQQAATVGQKAAPSGTNSKLN